MLGGYFDAAGDTFDLGTETAVSGTPIVSGDTLTIECEGSTIRLGANTGSGDTENQNFTDTTYASAGYGGAFGSAALGTDISDFDMGDIGAAGGSTATPSQGSITFTGQAPTATATDNKTASPSFVEIVFAGYAPGLSVTENVFANPGATQVAFTGFAPSASSTANKEASPSFASIVFSGYAPTSSVSAGDGIPIDQLFIPAVETWTAWEAPLFTTGVQVITSTHHLAEPSFASVTFTGFAPSTTAGNNKSASPEAGAIAFTGFTPSVTTTASFSISPDTGAVVFSGYAPSLDTGISPSFGTIAFTGYQPTATTTDALYAFPDAASVSFVGYAPTTAGGTAIAVITPRVAGGGPKKNRRTVILPDKRIVRADSEELQRLLQFYKVSQEELEKESEPIQKASRRQRRKLKSAAIPAPQIIEEMEEQEDLEFVLQEIARS